MTIRAWRVARGSGRLAAGGVRLAWHAALIGGSWFWLPASAGALAWWAGLPWWLGVGAAIVLGLYAAADGGDGPSAERFRREAQHRVEECRARAKALQVRREWPRLAERCGWASPDDLAKRRPVPQLRFVRPLGRRLLVAWQPPPSVPPAEYGVHVEELRRAIGAHSVDWRPSQVDVGAVVGMFALDPLPSLVAPSGPVGGQTPAPNEPGASAVQQAFTIGEGTAGPVAWRPFEAAHLVTVGATGSGKGSVVRSVASQAVEGGWTVVGVDGKCGGELLWLEERGGRVSRTGPEDAAAVLADLEELLVQRGAVLFSEGAESWRELDPAPWAPVLLVVDEVADLVLQRRGPGEREADGWRALVAARLNRLTSQGRAAGIHCLLSLQRPDASILSGFLRQNLAARVAVGSLDPDGCEMLGIPRDAAAAVLDGSPGRALALGLRAGHTTPTPVQLAYQTARSLRVAA